MKILKLLFIFLIFKVLHATGQQKELIFKNFTQEEGLPSNETYYVFEDSRHYLWIATDLGVARYNGSKFEVFNLPDNVIFKIKEDNKGRVWFFTHKAQLSYFENEKIYQYKYNENISNRIGSINIVDAYVSENGSIKLSSALDSNYTIKSDGVIEASTHVSNEKQASNFTIDYLKDKSCYTENKMRSIYSSDTINITLNLKEEKIVYKIPAKQRPFSHYGSITTDGKDFYFFGGNFLIKLMLNGSFKVKQLATEVLCLAKQQNIIRIGMMKGGSILLNSDLSDVIADTLLKNKSISSICYDYEGGIWFSSLEKGVFYTKNSKIQSLNINQISESVSRLLNINDSVLLYSNSSGLFKFTNNESVQLLNKTNYNISDLFLDDKRNIYCLGAFDFVNLVKKSSDNYFTQLYLVTSPSEGLLLNGDIFVYSHSNRTVLYKSNFINSSGYKSGLDSNYMHSKILINLPLKLFKDNANAIWGGYNDGLYKSNSNYDTILKVNRSSALLRKGVNCIRQLNNGMLVAGIRFGGIAILQDTMIIETITEKNGLLSNKIRYLMPLNNDLWVATAKGISIIRFSSYTPLRYEIVNIGKNDGFYNITINQLVQFQQKIVAATSNGIYFIEKPGGILDRKFPAIPFYINSINYYKGDTSEISNITLPYSKNRAIIKYNAVCFNSPEEIKYLYRFQTTDTNWTTTSNTELLLENLEPGSYNLQIKAVTTSQNRTSALLSLKIIVEKPWWQNNWLRLLILSIITSGIYLFVATRIKAIRNKEKRKTELNTKIAELEQTALRSQMNPHFIFNCLTSIQQLIVTGNKTDANEYLVKFARLIRKTLELSAIPFISIREEIEYLGDYIFLEQLRLSGQFNYTITTDINIDIDRTRIPNMMIQPVVENCIRHGIKPLENKKGAIDIRFEHKEKNIVCTITDNGVGRSHHTSPDSNTFTKHKSYGVDIIEKRLKAFAEFNQTDFGIQINDLLQNDGSPAGTEVIIQLPFKINV